MSDVSGGGTDTTRRRLVPFMLTLVCAIAAAAQSATSPEPKLPAATPLPQGSWRFIVSGDSRNCGDIVMPAIAAHSTRYAPSFYWQLGDLRAIYKIDEDMAFAAQNKGEVLSCDNYQRRAWNDFVENQIALPNRGPGRAAKTSIKRWWLSATKAKSPCTCSPATPIFIWKISSTRRSWIVGTAGAVRYPLPAGATPTAKTASMDTCWPQFQPTARFNLRLRSA
jgi:hypothetical protein